MKKKALFTKITAFVMTVVMLCPCLFSVTASAVVGGDDVTNDFQYISFEEMKNMSQEELAEYCRELAAYIDSQENTTSNPGGIQPFWSSETGSDYNEYTTTAATHYYITAYGFILFAFTANSMAHTNVFELTDLDIYTIMKFSEEPDKDGWKNGYRDHFYNPESDESYLNGKKENAKLSFINHYNNALTEYRKGNRITAMQELGRSLHFVQDVCEPHHSNNKTVPLNKHDKFETWVGNNFENIEAKYTISEWKYTYARNSELEKIFKDAAWSSYDQLSNASKTETFRIAAEKSLGNALLYTTLVLYRFMVTNGLC